MRYHTSTTHVTSCDVLLLPGEPGLTEIDELYLSIPLIVIHEDYSLSLTTSAPSPRKTLQMV